MWIDSYNNNKLTLDFELTTNCNAKCPQCSRTDEKNNSDRKSWLPLIQVSLAKFKSWFSAEDLSHIKNFHFSGSYGDPGMCKDLFEIVKYILENSNSTTVSINTNGGMRDETFWWKIGAVGGKKITVIFDVDGINQEMHNFYRQNVNLSKVLENMQAVLETDAKVKVFTVIFKHNQDYVEQIQQMCRDMGVEQFDSVQGNNFKSPTFEFVDQHGNKQQLEQTTIGRDDSIRPSRRVRDHRHVDKVKTYNKISCMAAANNNLKVSANGLVIPCCHIAPGIESLATYKYANKPFSHVTQSGEYASDLADSIKEFIENVDDHNLNNKSIFEIVSSKWYITTLADSINNDIQSSAFACRKVCGFK